MVNSTSEKSNYEKHTWTRAVYTPNTPILPFFVLVSISIRISKLKKKFKKKKLWVYVCKMLDQWRTIFDFERKNKQIAI